MDLPPMHSPPPTSISSCQPSLPNPHTTQPYPTLTQVFSTSDTVRETRGCSNGPSCDQIWRALLNETGWELLDAFHTTDALWASSLVLPFRQNQSGFQHLLLREQLAGDPTGTARPHSYRPYTDNFHYRCEVYEALNRQLVSRLNRRD